MKELIFYIIVVLYIVYEYIKLIIYKRRLKNASKIIDSFLQFNKVCTDCNAVYYCSIISVNGSELKIIWKLSENSCTPDKDCKCNNYLFDNFRLGKIPDNNIKKNTMKN